FGCLSLFSLFLSSTSPFNLCTLSLHDALPIYTMAFVSPNLDWLVVARIVSGAFAAGIFPLAMAWLGDNVPYETRQAALARLVSRSEEHTSELQSRENLVCRLLLEKKKICIKTQ